MDSTRNRGATWWGTSDHCVRCCGGGGRPASATAAALAGAALRGEKALACWYCVRFIIGSVSPCLKPEQAANRGASMLFAVNRALRP